MECSICYGIFNNIETHVNACLDGQYISPVLTECQKKAIVFGLKKSKVHSKNTFLD